MSGHLFLKKSLRKIWWKEKNAVSLHSLTRTRAFSSAGLEHLPYKQRVGGSNPSTPTSKQNAGQFVRHFSFIVIVAACLSFLRFAAVVACMACLPDSFCVLLKPQSVIMIRSVLLLYIELLFVGFCRHGGLCHEKANKKPPIETKRRAEGMNTQN